MWYIGVCMKKKILNYLLIFACIIACGIFTSGCLDMFGGGEINNSYDLVSTTPNDERAEDGKEYYTSKKLNLVTEINGSFKVGREFTLDENDENRRVYDDIYFYEDDFFKMDVSNSSKIYYELENEDDLEYVAINEDYGRIVIKKGKSGIYKLVFDITTFKFDIEYKSEIITPVYETIISCDIYTVATSWQQMTKNPENQDEFVIQNFQIARNKNVTFFSHNIHTSNYKVTLDSNCKGHFAYQTKERSVDVKAMIGGIYNVYLNSNTYVVRFELTNPETADYCLQVVTNSVTNIEQDAEHPYIFTCDYTAKRYMDLPSFRDQAYNEYNLSELSSEYVLNGHFQNVDYQTFILRINLLNFTVEVVGIVTE